MPTTDPATTSPNTTEIDRLRIVLLRLARRIRHSSSDDATPSQRIVLNSIIRHGQLTIGQIAEHEHVKPPSASKIVDGLERAGFVERRVHADDRRCVHVVATDAGHAYAEHARVAGRTWLASRLDELDEADVAAIDAALPSLERLLGGIE